MIAGLQIQRERTRDADAIDSALAQADLNEGNNAELRRVRRLGADLHRQLRWLTHQIRLKPPEGRLYQGNRADAYFTPPENAGNVELETPIGHPVPRSEREIENAAFYEAHFAQQAADAVADADETNPLRDETKPLFDETKPLFDETKPLSDETKPLSDETKPLFDETKPLFDEIDDETKPLDDSTEVVDGDYAGVEASWATADDSDEYEWLPVDWVEYMKPGSAERQRVDAQRESMRATART